MTITNHRRERNSFRAGDTRDQEEIVRRHMRRDITIFISYAHEDERLCTKLRKHLRLLERIKRVEVWSDPTILGGAEWEREVSYYLNTAQIIMLLISPDFMDSDYCYNIEMKRAMERHDAEEASVIPIILRPVNWEDAPFAKLQVLPTDAKPVTSKAWYSQDYAFFDIVQGVRKIIAGEKLHRPLSISIGYAHRQDFSEEAPAITNFYGREHELAALKRWIVDDRCRLVAVVGAGGIGKTSLALKLAEQIEDQFEYIFWRSLQHHSLRSVLQDCLHFISNQQKTELSEDIEDQLDALIPYLRDHSCLLILDNFESVMQADYPVAGSAEYGKLLERVGQARKSQSCLLLTSREKPREMIHFEGKSMPVRTLTLSGLSTVEGREILEDKGLSGNDDSAIDDLVRLYSGNPLFLQLVANLIQEILGGDITLFLREERAVVDEGIKNLLDEQFRRLSAREEDLMYWLAVERDAVSLNDLRENMLAPASKRSLPDSLLSLQRRSLIETRGISTFTLQPVIMEYVTERFIQRVCKEFEAETVVMLGSHALMKAQSQDYIRESQVRFIVMPVAKQLHDTLGQEAFEEKCKHILSQLRATPSQHAAYAAGNILNMLIQLGYDLHQYDFSHLTLQQAYLPGASLHDVNFEHANFVQPLFTDIFGDVLSAAWSPDGSLLAAGTDNGEIRIWDIFNGALIHTFRSNSDWIRSVAFSPDGTTIASGSEDCTVRLWDISTGVCRKILQGHTNWVWAVAFSSDGQSLVSGGQDGCIKLWDVVTGEALGTLDHPERAPFYSVAFSPDGKLLASGSDDHVLWLWDTSTGQLLKSLEGHTGSILSVTFSPDGKLLASGSEDTVVLWDVSTGELLNVLKGHKDWVWSVAFTADGKMLASGGEDRTVRIWDTNSGQCLKTLLGHTNTVWSVPFHPKGHILASGSADQTVRIWDVSGGWCLKVLRGYTNGILSVAFSPDGKTIASGSQDHKVRLWDVKTGQCRRILVGPEDRVWSVAFSPNGRQLVSGSTRVLHVWGIHDGQHRELTGYINWVYCVAFAPDGKTIASSGDNGDVRLYDISSGNYRTLVEVEKELAYSVAFSSDGKRLVIGLGEVYLWNLSSNEPPLIIKCAVPIYSVALSPDGDIIVGGGKGTSVIYLWDAHTGECLKTLTGHTGEIWSVAFSPDGKIIASGSDDYTIRLWDVNKKVCTKILQGHTDQVSAVVFNPNGKTIASGSKDGTIKRWSARTGRCLDTLRSDRPYERMNITGVRGITEAQKAMLKTLGAVEHKGESHELR